MIIGLGLLATLGLPVLLFEAMISAGIAAGLLFFLEMGIGLVIAIAGGLFI